MEILEVLFNQMSLFIVGLYGWLIVILFVVAVVNVIEKIVKLIGNQIIKLRRPAETQEIK